MADDITLPVTEVNASAPTSGPVMSFPAAFASNACSVEVYPFEGGPSVIQGGQIKAVTVDKTLLNGGVGQFAIELANGGPQGPEDPNTWSQILTPMSHVLIGMSRGDSAAIVMDGVLTAPGESQQWITKQEGSTAARSQTISGGDFAWFFKRFNYFALTFMGLTAGVPGIGGGVIPPSLMSVLSQGLVGGTNAENSNPVQVGMKWYNSVMAGTSGLLSNTFVPFVNGSRYLFPNIVTQNWENYPNVFIPYADYFMVGEESWMDKFLSIFPHPWYEFFVTTAPAGAYAIANGGTNVPAQNLFAMQSMPYAPPAGPMLVARVNPTPAFDISDPGAGSAPVPGAMDMSRWNALPLFDFTQTDYGFFNSSVAFSADGASNFYQLNPTYYKTIAPQNNANTTPVPFFFIAAADPASVQRYGFAPRIGTIRWMCDPMGLAAQNQSLDIEQTILSLTGRYISWFHPVPLMLQGQVTIPLTPTMLVGTRFRYAPFKDGIAWDFYITGFRHRFVFGGTCTTTLTLTRGLPADVYDDANLLQAIFTGNAMRANGEYVVGLPDGTGPALQIIETPQQAATLAGQMAQTYVTPQAMGQ